MVWIFFCSIVLVCLSVVAVCRRRGRRKRHVAVLVLGGIGQSPRMQNHATSLALHGYEVDLVGYQGETEFDDVLNARVKLRYLVTAPGWLTTNDRKLFVFFAPIKLLLQICSLIYTLLMRMERPGAMLVQNPPSMPTLVMAKLICLYWDCPLIIDWHNLGYSVLSLKLGDRHPLTRLAFRYENWCGKLADYNFTVSSAMDQFLRNDFCIRAPINVIHDKPPARFAPLDESERAMVKERLWILRDQLKSSSKLLVSSTSWTLDEDFSILLSALHQYDQSPRTLPHLLAVITGKGPMRDYYWKAIQTLSLTRVTIICAWLAPNEYPLLLAAADIGISLHTSSSGLDLPMKIVDMLGSGTPVYSCTFLAINELLVDGQNGFLFTSSSELCDLLIDTFDPSSSRLSNLKRWIKLNPIGNWSDEWSAQALPVWSRVFDGCQ